MCISCSFVKQAMPLRERERERESVRECVYVCACVRVCVCLCLCVCVLFSIQAMTGSTARELCAASKRCRV
jgi:hypothetical protein